jgi:uncharacterized heparinase superfamily protein
MMLPRSAAPLPGFIVKDMWPGDAERGEVIVRGDFEFSGNGVREAEAPWMADDISVAWLAEISEFEWLRDVRTIGSVPARTRARALILRWIETHGEWHPVSWRPDVLGARVANWIGQSEFLTAGAEAPFNDEFYRSLRRQIRHLQRVARYAAPGMARLTVLKGLIFAALALDNRKGLARSLHGLETEIGLQVLVDGGYITRNPSHQLAVMRQLIDIRTALRDAREDVPQELQTAIDRMAPMLRFFRHGDGGLALFNGSREEEGWLIDVVLTRSEARGKPLDSAPHSGFERLTANRTLILMDAGAPPPSGVDEQAHAGALSFEMSVGKDRVIVNCGAHHGDRASWRLAQRTTAAHSTLTVEDINSTEVLQDGGLGGTAATISVDRKQADGDIWIDSAHDGYQKAFGLTHARRLYLAASGGDLRGEDTLTGEGNHKFVVRFHLHPDVRASVVQEGNGVLLRLPAGAGWRFRASGGVITLQESVYLGSGFDVKRTEQIVVSSATQQGAGQVKWAFTQLAGGDD